MSLPFNKIFPVSGVYMPAIVDRRRVLPEPEGPTSAIYSPAPIFRFISFSEKLFHVLEIFLISNILALVAKQALPLQFMDVAAELALPYALPIE